MTGARRHGFTLLEVMVALAILAISLLTVTEIVSSALRSQVLARDLEVATLLARGKMAELTEQYEREGFGVGGDTEEGDFEEEGHPEFAWEMELVEPEGTLDGKALAAIFLGDEGGLAALLGGTPDANGITTVNPLAATIAAQVEQQLNGFAARLKQGVRELRLTVSWKEGARAESFTVVTHLVVLSAPGGLK